MLKKLIPIALAAGMTPEAAANAIGVKADELPTFMEGQADLTPDQVNALIMAMPDKPKAEMPPPASDSMSAPKVMPEAAADGDMAKIMVADAEYEVPKAVAEHIAMLEGRADRAGRRTDAAENSLSKAERELAQAKVELAKRDDAMSKMVPRADADRMACEKAQHIADAMELARRCHGHEWSPEGRKDAATGEPIPLSSTDWEMAAIRAAFAEKADAIIQRIDAAPSPEARAYAVRERLADARDILDRRDHKDVEVLESISKMRSNNAAADKNRQDGIEDDPLADAQRARSQFTAQPVGAPIYPQTKTGAA